MSVVADITDGQYVRRLIHLLESQGNAGDATRFIAWMEQEDITPEWLAGEARSLIDCYPDADDETHIIVVNTFLSGFLMGMSRGANRKGRR